MHVRKQSQLRERAGIVFPGGGMRAALSKMADRFVNPRLSAGMKCRKRKSSSRFSSHPRSGQAHTVAERGARRVIIWPWLEQCRGGRGRVRVLPFSEACERNKGPEYSRFCGLISPLLAGPRNRQRNGAACGAFSRRSSRTDLVPDREGWHAFRTSRRGFRRKAAESAPADGARRQAAGVAARAGGRHVTPTRCTSCRGPSDLLFSGHRSGPRSRRNAVHLRHSATTGATRPPSNLEF